MNTPIPFIDLKAQRLRLGDKIDTAVQAVFDHGQFIMGPEVALLEQQLADFCGAPHAVTCASGTDALLLPLMAWGVGAGDAVFVPSLTFVSTAEVVVLAGAVPVFVDVLPDTYNLDPASLEREIAGASRRGLRPRVVIAVDLFGQPADYESIAPIAEKHGLLLLADSAQGFGGSLKGRATGTFGHATSTSFFPAKPLGCYGDGGAVLTADESLAEQLRSLRVHGRGRHKYDNVRIGLNSRLDTVQAAILIQKLLIFRDEIEVRNQVAQRYQELLGDAVGGPWVRDGAVSTWAQYTIQVADRELVQSSLKAQGIPTAIYYPTPLHQQTGYRRFAFEDGLLPVTEYLSGRVMSLPMHPYLNAETQERIVDVVLHAVA